MKRKVLTALALAGAAIIATTALPVIPAEAQQFFSQPSRNQFGS